MYERLPPQSVAPDTEVREFEYWRSITIRQDFINTKVRSGDDVVNAEIKLWNGFDASRSTVIME
jgi:hypothetical protein